MLERCLKLVCYATYAQNIQFKVSRPAKGGILSKMLDRT